MPRIEDVERRLWLAAEHRAGRDYYRIGPGCEGHLRGFIGDGVKRIFEDHVGSDEIHIQLAETNIISFTTRMIIDAKGGPDAMLHEYNFFSVRGSICPLWPFC